MPKPTSPLARARRAALFNQTEFARLLGCSQQTLSKYESGALTPAQDRKVRAAKLLHTRVSTLWPPAPRRAKAVVQELHP